MILATLSFLAGLLLVQQFSVLPESQWLLGGVIAIGLIVWRRHWLCLCFSAGVLWAIVFASFRLADQLPKHLEGIDIPVKGTIRDLPEQNEKVVRFNFSIAESAVPLPDTVRLSWYNVEHPVKAGQHWSFTIKLKRPHGTLNPGAFDYERWLFTEGIGATGSVRSQPKAVLLTRDSAWRNVSIWRQAITDLLTQALPDSKNLGLIKALTLGDGSSISQAQWDIFRSTGTTHLFVISGSHIGLIAGLVYLLTLKFWARTGLLRWSPQKVAAGIALIFGVLYSALAGFTVPTQRAMIMLAIAMAAISLQRNNRPLHTLTLAMLAILIVDPLAILAVGFWLSFLAVALIVYTISARLKTPGNILGTLKINWATSVGLSPLLLMFFQQISLISPVANFVAVPVIGFLIVPLALVATIILPISSTLARPLFWAVDTVLQGLIGLLVQLANLPLSTLTHTAPSPWALAFAVPAVLLLLAPTGMPARSLSLILLLPLVFTKTQPPKTGHINMTVLDVGQGLAVAVQTATHWLVYDTGPKYSSGSDSGQTVLLPFLRGQKADSIDTLLVSHGDKDHIGGAETLLRNLPTASVITSAPALLRSHAPTPCTAGQSWLWDEVRFTMLSPEQPFESDNDNSCVLRIDSQQGSVLLAGDIEAEAEQRLVANYGQKLRANVLVSPHHGSKTSSTLEFLNAVAPETVIIPAGYLNQFGHPHRDVLARYQQIKARIFNTADSGAITINTEGSKGQVNAFRDTNGKYWNNKRND
jgi:competence protein ComEC